MQEKKDLTKVQKRGIIQCRVSDEIINLHQLSTEMAEANIELSFQIRMLADKLAIIGNTFHEEIENERN